MNEDKAHTLNSNGSKNGLLIYCFSIVYSNRSICSYHNCDQHFLHLTYDQTKDGLEFKSVPHRRQKLLIIVSLISFQPLVKQFEIEKFP